MTWIADWTGLSPLEFAVLAGAAALTGIVRGFAGFGAAMVFVPLASQVIPPQTAVIVLFIVDTTLSLPLTVKGFRVCTWSEIKPLFIGALFGAPVGVWLLATTPEDPMKWIVSLTVLAAVALLSSGYRRQKPMAMPGVIAVGGAAGVGSGLAGLSGPPVIVFWAGSNTSAAQMRWNIFAFFGLASLVSGTMHFWFGLFTLDRLILAAMLAAVYAPALWCGSRMFGLASERAFRIFALSLCTVAAIMLMPIWS